MMRIKNKHLYQLLSLHLLFIVLMVSPILSIASVQIGDHPTGCIAPRLKIPAWTDARGWNSDQFQHTIELANVTGDAGLELMGRDVQGMTVNRFEIDQDFKWWGAWLPGYSADERQSDLANPDWSQPERYSTIQFADIDGDGKDEMIAYDSGKDGMGLIAYRFEVDAGLANGNWVLISELNFYLPDHTDWTRAEYYQTFHAGRLLPGKAEQLVVRSKEGVISIAWDAETSAFKIIPDITKKKLFSDAAGWGKEKHYAGIRLADIDGDGIDELVGRGVEGLYAAKYIPGTGWKSIASPAGFLTDKIAGGAQYYPTITWGHFIDKKKQSLAIFTFKGVQLIQWDASEGWKKYTPASDSIFAGGANIRNFNNSFRAADIDGDGLDELHLYFSFGNSLGSGLESYRFSFTAGQTIGVWDRVNTGNKSSENNLPANGQTFHYGDINGDGMANAIGRTHLGLETFFYDPATKRWEENFSCGFPSFPGNEAHAYVAMNRLRFQAATEFRHEYNDASNNNSNHFWLEENKKRPVDSDRSYKQRDWNLVRSQLLRETDWASSALLVFSDQRRTFDENYSSEWKSMDTVGNALLERLNETTDIDIEALLQTLLNGAIDIATEGATLAFPKKEIEKFFVRGIGALLGAVSQGALKALYPENATKGTVSHIKNEILDKQQRALTEMENWAGDITGLSTAHPPKVGDLGTMAAVAALHQRNYWPANFSNAPFVADKVRWSFKRWLYQQILTSVYEVHIYDCAPGPFLCPEPTTLRTRVCYSTINRPIEATTPDKGKQPCEDHGIDSGHLIWVYLAIEKKGLFKSQTDTLPDDVTSTIVDKPSAQCAADGGYIVDKCTLGLDAQNLLHNRNGWNFTLVNLSIFVDDQGVPKGAVSCAGRDATIIGTEGPDVLIGTPGPDVIVSLGGNDVIHAGAGDDIVCSGNGNDRVFGGPGNDVLILGYGHDLGKGGRGDDWLVGETGGDALYGGRGDDVLDGHHGKDVLFGGEGYDIVHGGEEAELDLCIGEEETNCSSEVFGETVSSVNQ